MKGIYLGVLLAVILGIVTGCGSPAEVELDASDNGSQIEVEVGQILAVTLETNPTTGFWWEVAKLDDNVLQQQGSPSYRRLGKEVPGAGGLAIYRFEAVGVGQTTLELAYRCSVDEEPAWVFSVQVVVR
jgi:inhibitor of cysteine peptidase